MIHTVKELCYRLKVKNDELNFILENLSHFYYPSESTKTKYGDAQIENGVKKKRPLHPSIGRLKEIQHKINSEILSKLPATDFAFGSVKGRNNISNAKEHINGKYFFSVDLKSFFTSITNWKVYDTFANCGFSHDVSRILTRLTTYKGVLPQGTPTSPPLANLAFSFTGQKIVELLGERPIKFTSYLDDFTFSSRIDFKHLTPKILKILKEGGFWLSHKKISYRTKEPEVTGIIVVKGRLVPHHKILLKQKESNNQQLNFYISQIEKANASKA